MSSLNTAADPGPVDPTKTHLTRALKHDSPLISCRFDPSGRHIFFGAQDSRIWRWRLADDQKVEYRGHDSWSRGLAFDHAATQLISGGYDGRLIFWPLDADQPEPLRAIPAHDGWIRAVAVRPDDSLVATAGNDLVVRLWNLRDGTPAGELNGHESHIYNLAFHPDGKRLVSGDLKGNLLDWDVDTGKLVRTMKAEALHKYDTTFRADIGGPRCMAFNQEGTLLACGGITNVSNAFAGVGNPAIELLDWELGKRKLLQLSKDKLRGVAWGVALHPQQFTIGLSGGGGGGFLLFWKWDQEQEFHQLKLPNTARDLALSPDARQLATAHHDGQVRLSLMAEKAPA